MSLLRVLPILAASAALSACATLPPYAAPPAGADTATLDLSRLANAGPICVNGSQYALGSIKDGKLIVPTTGRIGLYSFLLIADYNVTYTCHPGISFRPAPGEVYLVNMEATGSGCLLEVYRKSDRNRIKLDIEATAGLPQYCK